MEKEQILFKCAANAMKKLEGVGGTIYLTDQAIRHQPHAFNIQSKVTTLKLQDIESFQTKNDFLVLKNLLIITMKDKSFYKFRLNKRKKFVEHLRRLVPEKE